MAKYGETHMFYHTLNDFGELLKRHLSPVVEAHVDKYEKHEDYALFVVLPFDSFEIRYNLKLRKYTDSGVSDSIEDSLLVMFKDKRNLRITGNLEKVRRDKLGGVIPYETHCIEKTILDFIASRERLTEGVKSNRRPKGKWNYSRVLSIFQSSLKYTKHAKLLMQCEVGQVSAFFNLQAKDEADFSSPYREHLFKVPKSYLSGQMEDVVATEFKGFFK